MIEKALAAPLESLSIDGLQTNGTHELK